MTRLSSNIKWKIPIFDPKLEKRLLLSYCERRLENNAMDQINLVFHEAFNRILPIPKLELNLQMIINSDSISTSRSFPSLPAFCVPVVKKESHIQNVNIHIYIYIY